MRLIEQSLKGLYLVEANAHTDERGIFYRSFCKSEFEKSGVEIEVCQTNVSVNPTCHTLRGFHYQRSPSFEKKVISVVSGEVFHAVVDLRSDSETFLQHATFELSADDARGVLVPEGLASAFLTMTAETIVIYHMGDFYDPGRYTGIRYNDPLVNIEWPSEPLLISQRDLNFPDLDPARL